MFSSFGPSDLNYTVSPDLPSQSGTGPGAGERHYFVSARVRVDFVILSCLCSCVSSTEIPGILRSCTSHCPLDAAGHQRVSEAHRMISCVLEIEHGCIYVLVLLRKVPLSESSAFFFFLEAELRLIITLRRLSLAA